MKLLIFTTIAPLLYWGIYLIAQESFDSKSDWLESKIKRPAQGNAGMVALLGLAILGVLFVTWKQVGNFWIYLLIAIASYAIMQRRKADIEREKWQRKVDLELPGLTQALTLMISAGISPIRAMQLISARSESLAAKEMQRLVSEVIDGESTVRAIDNFARRVESVGARRFSNALSIAIERGTPLVPVLTALLKDSQVDAKNEMLRRAGKAEIALLLPVVFLLLPISVLFALFPSITQLQNF